MENNKKIRYINYVANGIALLIIFFSVYICYSIIETGRSLWLDEAMLAISVSERSLSALTSEPLSWDQSAPVLYLYIVKIFSLTFGNNESAFRIWSMVSYLLMMGASYYIMKKILKVNLALIGCAYLANLIIILWYATEFKPYMSDCVAVLSVIIIYYLYREKKIKYYVVAIFFFIMLWYSNPSSFFIAAVLLFDFIEGVRKKDRTQIISSLIIGGVALISFIGYYFYWLKPVIDKGFMAQFWEKHKFPLIPLSLNDLTTQKDLLFDTMKDLGRYRNAILIINIVGLFINIFFTRNRYIHILYLGIFITLFASMLGMYPMINRLMLFLYPITAILFFYFISQLYSKNLTKYILTLSLSLIIVFSDNALHYLSFKANHYRATEEINDAMNYISHRIKPEEKIYVFHLSTPTFIYKNKYDDNKIPFQDSIVHYGQHEHPADAYPKDMDVLLTSKKPFYIIMSHVIDGQHFFLDSLSHNGHLSKEHDKHYTFVYYFESDSVMKRNVEIGE